MNITWRPLALAVAASSVLGGSVGALATAATSSSASTAAVAAAVEHVKDTTADNDLAAIKTELETIRGYLHTGIGSEEGKSAASLLTKICENTAPASKLGVALECGL